MSSFVILLGGDLTPCDRLAEKVQGLRAIAADSGMRHAKKLGLKPELWVGDFDSASAELIEEYSDSEKFTFDSNKDMTDGEIAIEQALSRGADRLIFIGAFGGPRMEHEFCHLTQAVQLANRGVNVELLDGRKEAYPIAPNRQLNLDFGSGTSFSILAFSDLKGLTIKGAKWPLERADVEFGSSLTLSNEVTGRLEISLDSGAALVLAQLER